MVVGIVVTVLAAYLPARQAAKVAPIAALRDVVGRPHRHLEAPGRLGTVVTVGRCGVHRHGPVGAAPIARSVSVRSRVFVGVAVLGPVIARPFTTDRSVRRCPGSAGMAGTLARENATRNPRRTCGNGVGADDRCRPGGVHHGVRGVGQGVDQRIGRQRR